MNLIQLIKLNPLASTLITILCLTFIISKIFYKMTTQESVSVSEAKIIRALIIARGKDGATLQEIKSQLEK